MVYRRAPSWLFLTLSLHSHFWICISPVRLAHITLCLSEILPYQTCNLPKPSSLLGNQTYSAFSESGCIWQQLIAFSSCGLHAAGATQKRFSVVGNQCQPELQYLMKESWGSVGLGQAVTGLCVIWNFWEATGSELIPYLHLHCSDEIRSLHSVTSWDLPHPSHKLPLVDSVQQPIPPCALYRGHIWQQSTGQHLSGETFVGRQTTSATISLEKTLTVWRPEMRSAWPPWDMRFLLMAIGSALAPNLNPHWLSEIYSLYLLFPESLSYLI